MNLTDWISNNGTAYKSSYYYQQVTKNFPSDADGRSFALRLIIHYVGDLHQPLHAVAEVDSKYPSGDQGGNAESLPSICGAGNLHAVWDSVAYNYCGYPVLVSNQSLCDVTKPIFEFSSNFFFFSHSHQQTGAGTRVKAAPWLLPTQSMFL